MRWALIGLMCGCGTVSAQEPDTDKTHRYPSTAVNSLERAGHPDEVSKLAKPGRNSHYTVGYTGGGLFSLTQRKREPREISYDGTWGSDYTLFSKRPGRIFLGWAHDKPHQPPHPKYEGIGPHVPDPVAAHPFVKLLTGRKKEGEGEKEE